MSARPTPVVIRFRELLADGAWHDRERVINDLVTLVPPGVALRHAEHVRALQWTRLGRVPPPRTRPVDPSTLIWHGARSIVVNRLSEYTETRTDDHGVSQIRLRAKARRYDRRMSRRSAQPADTVTTLFQSPAPAE